MVGNQVRALSLNRRHGTPTTAPRPRLRSAKRRPPTVAPGSGERSPNPAHTTDRLEESMRRRFTAVVPIVIAAMLATAACGSDDGDSQAADDGPVSLTVATFGEFGYKELYEEYMKLHPNVKITERITKTEDHHKNLAAHLATNTGAADIEALEEGWIGQFTAQPSKFYDLTEFGANDIKSQWPEWKWSVGASKDGKVIGLGTDAGGMAMCYRAGPVQEGRPADRPRRGLEALADLGAVHRDRQEVRGGQGAGRALLRRPDRHVPVDPRPGPDRPLRRRQRRGRQQPRREEGVRPVRAGGRRRGCRPAPRRGRRPGTPVSPRARSPRSPARRG